jgi:hypothetical protein
MMTHCVRALGLLAAAVLLPGSALAEDGSAAASTRLHRCGNQTCLLIQGKRSDSAAPVLVERHEVAVVGGRNWRVSLPLHTVRGWSRPSARSIAIDVAGKAEQAALPIGVFGHPTDLAFLTVSAL